MADYYLVAHAHDYVMVTHEIAPASTRRLKSPDACIELGVKAVTPYEMLRVEKARFVPGFRTQTSPSGPAAPSHQQLPGEDLGRGSDQPADTSMRRYSAGLGLNARSINPCRG